MQILLKLFFLFFLFLSLNRAKAQTKNELKLSAILESIEYFHPGLQSAQKEVKVAEARLKELQGIFDAKLKSIIKGRGSGKYDDEYFETRVEKPINNTGSSVYGSYRISDGTFPSYEGAFKTGNGGELGLGIYIPLLRDRIIDDGRADIVLAEMDVKIAKAYYKLTALDLFRQAKNAYVQWVSSHLKQYLLRDVFKTVESRSAQILQHVEAGDRPRFDYVDNQRLVLKWKNDYLKAQSDVAKAEIDLKLFFRNSFGGMRDVASFMPPKIFPFSLRSSAFNRDLLYSKALRHRPDLNLLKYSRDIARVSVDLGRNFFLPRLDLDVGVFKDKGKLDKTTDDSNLKTALKLEVPLETNKPEGKFESGIFKIKSIDLKERFLKQKIRLEVAKARVGLEYSKLRIVTFNQEVATAQELEEGERTRFELGDSNLIFLNIREQATAEAGLKRIDALVDFATAAVDVEFVSGILY
jgi:outer membrane protein, heavy metal efflux system